MQKIMEALPDALIALGSLTLSYGAGLVYQPAGFIVGGALLIGFGILASKTEPKAGE